MMVMFVFASRDVPEAHEARALAARLGARFVDRISTDLGDLRLVAQHRVVEPVCILVLLEDRVILRVPHLLSADEVARAVAVL